MAKGILVTPGLGTDYIVLDHIVLVSEYYFLNIVYGGAA